MLHSLDVSWLVVCVCVRTYVGVPVWVCCVVSGCVESVNVTADDR